MLADSYFFSVNFLNLVLGFCEPTARFVSAQPSNRLISICSALT
jgi:hypothetical protein